MMKKLRSRRGETLVEALLSILILSMGTALLFGLILAATTINRQTDQATDGFYLQLTHAETGQSGDDTQTVTINGTGVTVTYYGDPERDLSAYRKEAGG